MAYIEETARVSGWAVVSGSARVSGWALVSGSAVVSGSAQVSGSAVVSGSAQVSASHVVRDQKLWRTIPTINTSDGYTVAYWPNHDGVWMITAGCRYFTMEEAREHCINTRGGTDLGRERLMILDWLGVWRETTGQAWYNQGPPA